MTPSRARSARGERAVRPASPGTRSAHAHAWLAGVRAPKPLLAPASERGLSARQAEVLDELEARLLRGGLGGLTMAEIAARAGCSLRTLYGIAPSRDELLLTVVDRRLHRIGRAAVAALDAQHAPLAALRAYLRAANEAVQPEAVALSAELTGVGGWRRLFDAHENYLVAVTQNLLESAVREGHIATLDCAALAHVLAGLGREFARPELADLVQRSPKETADAIADLIFAGLERSRESSPHARPGARG